MGGMGQAIYEDGVRQGEKNGKAQGSLDRLVSDVRGAIDAFGATAETALAAFGVPRDEWPAVIARLDPPRGNDAQGSIGEQPPANPGWP